jgi:hypothetical protein
MINNARKRMVTERAKSLKFVSGCDDRPPLRADSGRFVSTECVRMKTRQNLVRLKQFQVSEKRRQLLQLDMMIAEFDRMAGELDAQINSEEKKAGITDVNHFAYPTFAKAARQRRDNLTNSRNDLASQRHAAETALAEAEDELAKAEALESRDHKLREGEVTGRVMTG